MKKILLIILIVTSFNSFAQTAQDLFSPKQLTVTWLGVDFSNVKYICKEGSNQEANVKKYFKDYIIRINEQIASDHHRYYFPIAFKKDFLYNTKDIDKINKNITDSNISHEKHDYEHLSLADIKTIVSKYSFEDSLKGVGLVFIMEGMSESGSNKAIMWITYVDISKKELLFTKQMDVEAAGPTFEEEWGHSILQVLREVKGNFTKWSENPDKYNALTQK